MKRKREENDIHVVESTRPKKKVKLEDGDYYVLKRFQETKEQNDKVRSHNLKLRSVQLRLLDDMLKIPGPHCVTYHNRELGVTYGIFIACDHILGTIDKDPYNKNPAIGIIFLNDGMNKNIKRSCNIYAQNIGRHIIIPGKLKGDYKGNKSGNVQYKLFWLSHSYYMIRYGNKQVYFFGLKTKKHPFVREKIKQAQCIFIDDSCNMHYVAESLREGISDLQNMYGMQSVLKFTFQNITKVKIICSPIVGRAQRIPIQTERLAHTMSRFTQTVNISTPDLIRFHMMINRRKNMTLFNIILSQLGRIFPGGDKDFLRIRKFIPYTIRKVVENTIVPKIGSKLRLDILMENEMRYGVVHNVNIACKTLYNMNRGSEEEKKYRQRVELKQFRFIKKNTGIIGSREFINREIFNARINQICWNKKYIFGYIVSGACRGADTMAREYAQRRGIKLIEHKPKFNEYGSPAAYHVRNDLIVRDSEYMIGFPKYKTNPNSKISGTESTLNKAIKKDIPISSILIFNNKIE